MDRRNDPIFVHYYRAVVAHMDVWRQRMDATTNWAAATAAGMITFTFSTASTPHYVLLLALAFQTVFLLMESRRYQTFDLWRHRFRKLNRILIVPALQNRPLDDAAEREMQELALDMGRTVPHLDLFHAIGYRARRNYGYLFAVTLLAWLMKLEIQPTPALTLAEFLQRATIAFIPGSAVFAMVVMSVATLLLVAVRAPTGDMLNWEATDPPWTRWSAHVRRFAGTGIRRRPGRQNRRSEMADIVLATRFGPSSAEPARVAARLARQIGARIIVLYVATELQALQVGGAESGLDPATERERIDRRINDELREFIDTHLRDEPFDVRVVEGDVADCVSRVATEVGAAYIVVGTRGRGQLARLILGDTTQSILQRTPCPVIVVPLRVAEEPGA